MRYCVFTLVSVMLAVAAGCQAPLHNGMYGGGEARGIFNHLGIRTPGVEPGAVPAWFNSEMNPGPGGGMGGPQMTSQIQFEGPEGMIINYDVFTHGTFDSEPLVCPAVHNFAQGAVYRLKVSNIPSMPGRDLYPTIEIAPTFARTQAFLAHNMIPVEFTDNDFDQVAAGNFITKVVYLPNPEFQSIATAGVGTLVNTQLEPGVDPIVEAENRGAILAVIRIGNKDLSMDAVPHLENANIISMNDSYTNPSQDVPEPPELTRTPRTTTVRPTPLVTPPQPETM